MIFDISTPDSAWNFVKELFNVSGSEFIDDYAVECGADYDVYWDKHLEYIKSINIDNMWYKALHVTSSIDGCQEIRTEGIKGLKAVLSEENSFSELLKENGIIFDLKAKILFVDDETYNMDYCALCNQSMVTQKDRYLKEIARRINVDSQINAFFAVDSIENYGTEIHHRPEFLMDITNFLPHKRNIEKIWIRKSEGYVVTYLAQFKDFAQFTFSISDEEHDKDTDSVLRLKKWLIEIAISRAHSSIATDQVFAYMEKDIIIKPNQIIDIVKL